MPTPSEGAHLGGLLAGRRGSAGLDAAALLGALGCGVLVHDRNGAVVAANDEAERLLGAPLERLRGRVPLGALWRVVDETDQPVPEAEAPPMLALRRGRPAGPELLGFGDEPRRRWARVESRPLVDADGRVDGVVTTLVDAADERALRAQVARLVAFEPARQLGEMARTVAHDLNQRLTVAVGHAERALQLAARSRATPKRVRAAVRASIDATHEGAAAVRRIQTYGRPDAAAEPLQLGELLRDAAAFTHPRWHSLPRLQGRPIHLVVDAKGDTTIRGRRGELHELFTNLIFNAVDAMPRGGTIDLHARRVGAQIVVEVTDSGVGMSKELQARVFEPFFTTKGDAGTGLGLPSVRRAVEHHGGTLELRSSEGIGTTFAIAFPAALPAAEPPASPTTAPIPRGRRILVVDDDAEIAGLLHAQLTPHGHTVAVVHSRAAAHARLARGDFDVLIADLAVDGGVPSWDVIDDARADHPHLAVVLCSGWASNLAPGEAAAHGVRAVLAKPWRLEELHAAIATGD